MDEILLFGTSHALAGRAIMRVDMRRTLLDGILKSHMTFKTLVQIPGLRNVYGNPITIREQFGVDVDPGKRPKSGVSGVDGVGVFFAGLSGPVVRFDALLQRGWTTEN